MTKAKTTSRRAANAGARTKIAPTTAETKAKRQRGKAAPSDEGGAKTAPAIARTERPTETLITHSIPPAPSKPPRQTKAALLHAQLAEPGGVSLAALIEATGWQAHTLRAYLSGLRKEGLTLSRRREGDDTIYAIEPGGSGAKKDSTSAVPAEVPTGSTVDTSSGEVPAVQGSGDGVDDADTGPASSETNA